MEDNLTKEEAKQLILSLSNPKCKPCYGRGYTGWNEQGNPIVCKCVKKNLELRKNNGQLH